MLSGVLSRSLKSIKSNMVILNKAKIQRTILGSVKMRGRCSWRWPRVWVWSSHVLILLRRKGAELPRLKTWLWLEPSRSLWAGQLRQATYLKSRPEMTYINSS